MKYRPLTLTLMSCFFLVIAVSIPLQVFILQDMHEAFSNITWLNWMVIGFCLMSAWLAKDARSDYPLIALATIAVVAFNNWWVGEVGLDYSLGLTTFATGVFIGTHAFFLREPIRALFVSPETRWWLTPKRQRVMVPVTISPWLGRKTLKVTTFDFSETGLFVHGILDEDIELFNMGDRVELKMNFNGTKEVHCTGKLVRRSEGKGYYPAGLGLTFEGLSRQNRKFLKNYQPAA